MARLSANGARVAADSGGRWYAVVDTAQDRALLGLVKQCAQHICLISGELDPVLAAALPWVVLLDASSPLATEWRSRGEGHNWGIMMQSPMPLEHVKLLFKKFLNAILPDGNTVLFRFYDPRVFRTCLRAATPPEQADWFRGIARYSVESEQPGRYHDFTLQNGQLYDGREPVLGAPA